MNIYVSYARQAGVAKNIQNSEYFDAARSKASVSFKQGGVDSTYLLVLVPRRKKKALSLPFVLFTRT